VRGWNVDHWWPLSAIDAAQQFELNVWTPGIQYLLRGWFCPLTAAEENEALFERIGASERQSLEPLVGCSLRPVDHPIEECRLYRGTAGEDEEQ